MDRTYPRAPIEAVQSGRMGEALARLVLPETAGILRTNGDPSWNSRLSYLAGKGKLQRVLPGVYVDPAAVDTLELKVRAVKALDPNAIIVGRAAAALTFWPKLAVGDIEVANRRQRGSWPGFLFSERQVPAEHIVERHGVRMSSAAWTAVDLAGRMKDGAPLDQVLLRRAATVEQIPQALGATPWRWGNKVRRQLVAESGFGAFSALERKGHKILRGAGITDWLANQPILINGRWYLPDVRMRRKRLILEFDGRLFHSRPETFVSDRVKYRDMGLGGYLVLPFTYGCVVDDPEGFVAQVRRGLRIAPDY